MKNVFKIGIVRLLLKKQRKQFNNKNKLIL